jgi:hypothetical protein
LRVWEFSGDAIRCINVDGEGGIDLAHGFLLSFEVGSGFWGFRRMAQRWTWVLGSLAKSKLEKLQVWLWI